MWAEAGGTEARKTARFAEFVLFMKSVQKEVRFLYLQISGSMGINFLHMDDKYFNRIACWYSMYKLLRSVHAITTASPINGGLWEISQK